MPRDPRVVLVAVNTDGTVMRETLVAALPAAMADEYTAKPLGEAEAEDNWAADQLHRGNRIARFRTFAAYSAWRDDQHAFAFSPDVRGPDGERL